MKKVFFFTLFILSAIVGVFADSQYFTQNSLKEILPGKENDSVRRLQQVLYDFGYYKTEDIEPEFSGKFENDLRLALEDFQRTNNLRISGRADMLTLKTLNEFVRYQNEDIAKNNATDNDSSESDEMGYKVEEKNYFEDSSGDIATIYGGTRQQESQIKEQPVIAKKVTGGLIDGIFSSILNFFTPSEKYRSQSRQELETKQTQTKTNKFQDYGYFECIADDECIQLMSSKSEGK